jgi:hypothetical protein
MHLWFYVWDWGWLVVVAVWLRDDCRARFGA